MDTDLALILGILLLCLAIPSILSTVSDRRRPRLGVGLVLGGGALVLWAGLTHPGGYAHSDVPDVFLHVLDRFIP